MTVKKPQGFNVEPHSNSQRIQVVTLEADVIKKFATRVKKWPVQALEYKPFNRFAIADALNKLCGDTLGEFLLATLKNRETGAFIIQFDQAEQWDSDFYVQLATAISHLVGLPNFDSMSQKYYARFTIKSTDDSDSYLRKGYRPLELHNDGTYVDEPTDYVLMMKMREENMVGGDSLILHLDDWNDCERFYHHPVARQDIVWGSPPSKNVPYKVKHPIFIEDDENGKPRMLYIDQFAEPQNMQQGLYLYELGESLEQDKKTVNVTVNTGSILVIQNHCWLHGRDKFASHDGLIRELMRQRGHFTH